MVFAELESVVATAAAPKLFRGTLNVPDLELPLTCSSLQASRLAWLGGSRFAFASGTTVHVVRADGSAKRPRTGSSDAPAALGSEIAEDYLVPRALDGLHADRAAAHSTHRLEVQTVAAGSGLLVSTDALGRTVASRAEDVTAGLATLTPPDVALGPAGWAGGAVAPGGAGVAVARAGFRDVCIFDGDVCVRTLHTRFTPGAVAFRDPTTLALAEGAFVSLYDIRTRARVPSVSRRVCSTGVLRSIAVIDAGATLLVAGDDRAVHQLGAAGLAPRGRWGPCLKYEAAAVVPAGAGEAAVASVDNEVAVGVFGDAEVPGPKKERTLMLSGAAALAGGKRRRCGFRADVRVVGLARAENGDVATLSESGALYILRGGSG